MRNDYHARYSLHAASNRSTVLAKRMCDGASAACPVDAKLTSECRASSDVCDVAETCDGIADRPS